MKITLFVKRDDLSKLSAFLERGEVLDICWSERMFLDHIQVTLDYTDYVRLVEISSKLIDEPDQSEEPQEIDFWSLPEEELLVFNEKGLFSLNQMQSAFLAGSAYYASLQAEQDGEVFSKPVNFQEWFESSVHVSNKA